MAARKYAYDDDASLESCLHDQQRYSRSSPSGLYRMESGVKTRSGVVAINRASAPAPPTIPRAASVPDLVVGERTSDFEIAGLPRPIPLGSLIVAAALFLTMTILASIAYYR